MQERDTFSILYYFIISQFSTAGPRPSPPGLIPLPHSPLKHHLHVYLCISLPAVISQPGYGVGKNKLDFPWSDIMILPYSSAVIKKKRKTRLFTRTDARGAARDPAAVTTQPRTIGKRPRRGSCPFPHPFPWLTAFILKTRGRFHYDKALVSYCEKWQWVQRRTAHAFQNRTFVFILEEERAIIKLSEMNVSRRRCAGALRRLLGPPRGCYTSLLTRR